MKKLTKKEIANKLVIALDFNSGKFAKSFAFSIESYSESYLGFSGYSPSFKIGTQLFTSEGLVNLYELFSNYNIMLDLKLHDIPSTVYKTIRSISRRVKPPKWITIHSSGGIEMIEAASEAAKEVGSEIIAVTELTSIDNEQFGFLSGRPTYSLENVIYDRAYFSMTHGCSGVVSSPMNVCSLRDRLGPPLIRKDPIIITPGIRSKGITKNDQKRTGTPSQALRDGSDYLVVGRQVTEAQSPEREYRNLIEEIYGEQEV